MKLIIIYGAPAAGKMTVSKELCKITNARFFPHNLIFELIMPLITEKINDDDLWDLYEEIKFSIIKTAKKKGNSLVLTEIYDNPISNERFKKFIGDLRNAKISYKFVKLTCDKGELMKRVVNSSRKNTKKVNNVETLNKIIAKNNLDSEIPFVKNLVINNTKLSAKKTAQKIKEELNLK